MRDVSSGERQGSRFGPDLSEIGATRRLAEIQRSLVDPDAEMLAANRIVRAVHARRDKVTGRILNQDTFTVQVLDSKERLSSLSKSNLREFGFLPKSPMPSYRDQSQPARNYRISSVTWSL